MSFDRRENDLLKLNQISGFNIWPSLKRSLQPVGDVNSVDWKRAKRDDFDAKKMNLVLAPSGLDPASLCQHQ